MTTPERVALEAGELDRAGGRAPSTASASPRYRPPAPAAVARRRDRQSAACCV